MYNLTVAKNNLQSLLIQHLTRTVAFVNRIAGKLLTVSALASNFKVSILFSDPE